jgi:MOSC domain-containing protein YiiM
MMTLPLAGQPPRYTAVGLRIGRCQPLIADGPLSAIDKQPVAGAIVLLATGLAGDQQADGQHHGGLEKALHHYPAEHYPAWRCEIPAADGRLVAGGFGENLSTLGLTEDKVCIGDVFRLGGARIQVSQPRQPCWKLNLRFGVDDMARRVQDCARTGWYYRVLTAGEVTAGDRLEFVERCQHRWTLAAILRILYRDCLLREALADLCQLELLAPALRNLLTRRLQTGQVEDWSRRLCGHLAGGVIPRLSRALPTIVGPAQ